MNLYDNAHLNVNQFLYEREFGTPEKQRTYLAQAVQNSYQKNYFKSDTYTNLLGELFVLQATQHRFSQAINTYDLLSKQENSLEILNKLKPLSTKITTIKTDDTIYRVNGVLGNSGNWGINVFKPTFTFSNIDGKIEELKLRCSKKFVFFAFQENKAYHVSKNYGDCNLSVIGTPNTTFQLIQSL